MLSRGLDCRQDHSLIVGEENYTMVGPEILVRGRLGEPNLLR